MCFTRRSIETVGPQRMWSFHVVAVLPEAPSAASPPPRSCLLL